MIFEARQYCIIVNMKVLIFTEGTVLMHKSAKDVSRKERVNQVIRNNPMVKDYKTYIPNSLAVKKIQKWNNQGAEIYYLTSRRDNKEVDEIRNVLIQYSFPQSENLNYRAENESYAKVVEKIMPDVLIEDDCESIGGEVEMTYPNINLEAQKQIKSVVVREFEGIDNLSEDIELL